MQLKKLTNSSRSTLYQYQRGLWVDNITHNHFTVLWILFRITRVSQYQKGKTNLNFKKARTDWVAVASASSPCSRQNNMSVPHLCWLPNANIPHQLFTQFLQASVKVKANVSWNIKLKYQQPHAEIFQSVCILFCSKKLRTVSSNLMKGVHQTFDIREL